MGKVLSINLLTGDSMPHQPRLISEPESEYKLTPEEQARKDEYLQRLRQYLQDPEFRQIPGFPIGDDEAILALSDPPYYTACPNPFLPEIIKEWQSERAELQRELGLPEDNAENGNGYHREPFAADVSEGKNNPIYNAHSYHTKVPHPAIMRYILHYTDPGDIVFDGFCGTGMTGVAAQLCGDRVEVEKLGYYVDAEGFIFEKIGDEEPISRLGPRKAVLNDLSPAATFIAYNYNTPVDVEAFEREARRILDEVEEECGWMYETWHPHCDDPNRVKANINYSVWSDVFICPNCDREVVFFDLAVDYDAEKVLDAFSCPKCEVELSKKVLERAYITEFASIKRKTIKRAKVVPILISYKVGNRRFEKRPDREDLIVFNEASDAAITHWAPDVRIDKDIDIWYERDYRSLGVYVVNDFYTQKNLKTLSALWEKISSQNLPNKLVNLIKFCITAVMMNISKMNRWPRLRGPLAGTLYIPSIFYEINPFQTLSRRIKRVARVWNYTHNPVLIDTSSASRDIELCKYVDYIFTDPPFGSNIIYSDLSIIWESWLQTHTNIDEETVVHRRKQGSRHKISDYARMMSFAFGSMFKRLKPGRWMTVEFHNTQNAVWNVIQEAISSAGFVVADVRTLDKKQSSFKQVTATGSVKDDLVISAYKPNDGLEERFRLQMGSADGAWSFIRYHLSKLPVAVCTNGDLEALSERQAYLLFDRMVAFHIQRGATVPLSAAEFYAGLEERFPKRDGMYFLSEQTPEYDRARLEAESVAQLTLFVSDEKTAIQWLRQQLDPQLGGTSQTYQDMQPKFLRQLHQAKHEVLPELSLLLEQNFLQDDAGLWYVPDPNKASDLEALRRKALLREFNTYLEVTKKLCQFRTEAVRAGFTEAYQGKDFPVILKVAERLPLRVLQEDPDLLMYYDAASLRGE